MRSMNFTMTTETSQKRIDTDYYVEGYATTWQPYVLYHDYDGNEVSEQILRESLDGADASDIIFQFDHEGLPLARTNNGTLIVERDNHGLFVCADLSKTQASRDLYESIKEKMVTQMSWRYRVNEESFDTSRKLWTTRKVAKIYDVSAVSIPANDHTSIEARKKALMDEDRAKKQRETQTERLNLLLQLEEEIKC